MQNQVLLLIPVILPLIAGALVWALHMEDRGKRQMFVTASVAINLVVTCIVLFTFRGQSLTLFQFSEKFSLMLRVDDLSVVFGLLVSVLWLLTSFYAFGYMSHEGKEVRFFAFFTAALGVVTGIALAGNPLTLYMFYEFLTLITLPLVVHTETKEAMAAGKKYLLYSFAGSVLIFISLAILIGYSSELSFTYGGMLDMARAVPDTPMLGWAFLAGFVGFGVKAAVVPMHGWLPSAYVAPMPVTALLHAVAVVKAGVFGIMRLTYYCFGPEIFKGSWVQWVCLILAWITILYGSTKAVLIPHLKKRLAYSTISQLSYIVSVVMFMSPAGLQAGLIHMAFHGLVKITLFFCCGSVMFMTDVTDVNDMGGFGKYMPKTFICFLIASIALVGLPPTVGIISKWYLLTAAFQLGNPTQGLIGMIVIMTSALLTALYLLPLAIKAFLPGKKDLKTFTKTMDPPATMAVPVIILTIAIVGLGLYPGVVTNFITQIGIIS